MPSTALVWYHPEEGSAPDAHRIPWSASVSGATITVATTGLTIEQTTTALARYRRKMLPESSIQRALDGDLAEVQAIVRGVAQSPGWSDGASPIALGMDDGARAAAIAIGPSLQWIDPYGGTVLRTIDDRFGWQKSRAVHIRKRRSAVWEVYVDGRLVDTLPYLAAPPSAGDGFGWFLFGHLDAAGTSESVWSQVEAGLNVSLPPQWKVDRARTAELGPPILRRWNARWRAVVRTALGVAQEVQNAISGAYDESTAHRVVGEEWSFDGDVLPSSVDGWTVSGGPGAIERERWVIDGTTAGYAQVSFSDQTQDEAEFRARATFSVQEPSTTDPQGRIGPYLEVRNGERRVRAELFKVGADQYAWQLVEGALAGPVTVVGGIAWLVEERRPHQVELQVLGRSQKNGRVLLIVDEAVVDDVAYSTLSDAVVTRSATIGRIGGAGISANVAIEHGLGGTRYPDLRTRPGLLQEVAERLVFAGGCERNDFLDQLLRMHHQLQALRGTQHGTLRELRRLTCSDDTGFVLDTTPAGWFLEVSHPEYTPVFLEAAGTIDDVQWEIRNNLRLLTLDRLAELALRYLLPVSTRTLRYRLWLAAEFTAANSTFSGSLDVFTVDEPLGFAAGDTVLIRNAANTASESAVIDSVSGSDIYVPTLSTTYAIGSIVRRALGSTF